MVEMGCIYSGDGWVHGGSRRRQIQWQIRDGDGGFGLDLNSAFGFGDREGFGSSKGDWERSRETGFGRK